METDASNVGLGAILSQEHNNTLYPIAFGSRKMVPAEKNYSISEKEMLAALWGMEQFQYFLRGKEFELITDHRALQALNTKGELKSARIHRWIERIQNFSFIVTYKQGKEIPHVDALSRSFNEEKNVCSIQKREPTMEEKIMEIHKDLVHRGAKLVYEHLKETGEPNGTLKKCQEVLKNCITCKLYNPIKVKGTRHVQAYEVGELLAIDIIGPYENEYIITGIDYFSRYAFAEIIPSRNTEYILNFLNTIKEKINFKTLISDGAKEMNRK